MVDPELSERGARTIKEEWSANLIINKIIIKQTGMFIKSCKRVTLDRIKNNRDLNYI